MDRFKFNIHAFRVKLLVLMLSMMIGLSLSARPVKPVKNIIQIFDAPKGIILNTNYKVFAGRKPVPVFNVKIGAADADRRFKAVDDLLHSELYFDTAAFAYFDLQGTATVTVSTSAKIKTVKILPNAAGIKFTISGNTLTFLASKPQNLTVEINGEVIKSLHIFINPIEKNPPSPKDPNVIYFGPGIHDVSGMVIGDHKTVYVAGGAIVRAVIGPKETFGIEPSGFKNYAPSFELRGKDIKFRGHGIIDASACTTHARNFIMVHGSNISLDGIILVNSSGWTVPLRESNNVTINNIKILGYRANSDGIDICNSSNVTVQNCFIRTNDDLIVVKTEAGEGKANHIIVRNCVLWNQLANALSLGAELREDVDDVLFTNCDIIHDYSRAWCLRIFHSDAAKISNITFDRIRLEEAHQFISVWIGKDIASFSKQAGYINNVIFSNIQATGQPLNIDLVGAGEQNRVQKVLFKNVKLNGKALIRDHVKNNQFADQIVLQP